MIKWPNQKGRESGGGEGCMAKRARQVGAGESAVTVRDGLGEVEAWFARRGWAPWRFQREAWEAYRAGRSGLIQVPTGSGKTYAAYFGAFAELIDEVRRELTSGAPRGLRILYVSPLRAVSRDITLALQEPAREMGLSVRVEARTGDTPASLRAKQKAGLPEVLVTTPESLTLLLTREDAAGIFAGVTCAIVDEWHELLSSKRGTQVELALARLRRFATAMRTWGMSATIENATEAGRVLVGTNGQMVNSPNGQMGKGGRDEGERGEPVIITAEIQRPIVIDSILPGGEVNLPWAGHLGLSMLPAVMGRLDPAKSTLIFTNTRSQAELWHHAILAVKPEWEPITALHHGSIDRAERERVEAGIKDGTIRFVVATSSLDLGVDFAPVERVLQIGSPKGVGRLVQRAGRASHRPGAACEILCVPTHGMELVEIAAVRRAVARGVMEARTPLQKPLDVLAQHLVTCALGGGFDAEAMYEEVRTAWSYRDLTREEFEWTLVMVRDGGAALSAYERYKRVKQDGAMYRVPDKGHATVHRLNVGTIVGTAVLDVKYRSGKRIGFIEESFVAWLKPGEKFIFGGKVLRFLSLQSARGELTCFVEPASGKTGVTPHWAGTRLPISEGLSSAVRGVLSAWAGGERGTSPEMERAAGILETQAKVSRVPREGEVLAEVCRTREGTHLFVYPFEGRLVHAGLGALLALRLTRKVKATFAVTVNDYGFELLTGTEMEIEGKLTPEIFSAASLAEDTLESVDVAEIAKVQFREVARVAGLVVSGYPGARRSERQTMVSSSLIYDVFKEFDPGNLLLLQARREVLERHFERSRLARTMERLRASSAGEGGLRLVIVNPVRPGPLAYPLVVERMSAILTGETLADRLATMRASWDTMSGSNSGKDGDAAGAMRTERPGVARKSRGMRFLS
jgi:ATP-dependent helicase Lhr and Lhr-like helicase